MTITQKLTDPTKRYDFLLIFDVSDGNPNGDPDAGNLPRIDPETMQGIVTDVCLKRKIRNYVDLLYGSNYDELDRNGRFGIFVRDSGVYLNEKIAGNYEDANGDAKPKDKRKDERVREGRARELMCQRYYDVRLFGGVLSTGDKSDPKCGQVRGPVQLTFARSVDPVIPGDVTITRVAITNSKKETDTEIGRKAVVPYGLYVGKGFFSPMLAKDTGLDQADLELFWQALANMFENDRSAARGDMRLRQVFVFCHQNPLGNAHAGKLFDRVRVERKPGIEAPRKFEDYELSVDESLPEGVELVRLLD